MSVKNSHHDRLQDIAIGWLHANGCSIFAKEVPTGNGVADALGIRTRNEKEVVYYIEAKVSRSDLTCKKQKRVYNHSLGLLTDRELRCYYHAFWDNGNGEYCNPDNADCPACAEVRKQNGDTGIDYYYLIVADGLNVEPSLYPAWGVLSEAGKVIRKAKRMRRESDVKPLIIAAAHVLVYKAYGKLYIETNIPCPLRNL